MAYSRAMKPGLISVLCVAALAAVACGGDDITVAPADGGSFDGTADATVPPRDGGGDASDLPPVTGTLGISGAGPQIDDQFAVDPGGDRCANFLALQKVLLERLAYAIETRLA